MGFINDTQLRTIRKKLNKGTSSMFVYGMGCDVGHVDTYMNNPELHHLFSKQSVAQNHTWKQLLQTQGKVSKNRFIRNYFRELAQAPEYANSHCYMLKTSIVDTIDKNEMTRCTVLELNGNLSEGVNSNGHIVKIEEDLIEGLFSTFPDPQYTSQKKAVALMEDCFRTDLIQITLFIGTSGVCPVVESMYNRALTNKSLIVVVNPDPHCYLHDLADISLKMNSETFFNEINDYFSNFSEVYSDL